MSDVVAVLCSDIHLSHTPPAARAAEPDWYAAMERALSQVILEARSADASLLVAGDVFNSWFAPPELTNFAIDVLRQAPDVYAIPGQHDLPNHVYENRHRSAYLTLHLAGVVHDICVPEHVGRGLTVYPFPWGSGITPCTDGGGLCVALIHKYCWVDENRHADADNEDHVTKRAECLTGYTCAVFGDNHRGFLTRVNGVDILNCGTLMRRRIDEMEYRPSFGLLHSDGTITRQFLDTSADVWTDEAYDMRGHHDAALVEAREFVEDLRSIVAIEDLDYRDAVRRASGELSFGARSVLLEVLDQS